MTQQVNGTEDNTRVLTDEELYEAEWGTPTDASGSEDDGASGEVDQDKAADGATVSPPVVDANSADHAKAATTNSAEGVVSDDIWASSTPAQRQAYLKAQNDFAAMKGRHRATEQQKATLEKDLQTARSEFASATRKKGTYETEHPELFQEVTSFLKTQAPAQAAPAATAEAADDDLKVIFKVHKDVQDVLRSDDWSAFQKGFTVDQNQKFNSSDPYEFIDLVSEFKLSRATRSAAKISTPADRNAALLAAAKGVSTGAASKVDSRRQNMSVQEDYDAEWDNA